MRKINFSGARTESSRDPRAHLIGAGGAGMKALAEILCDAGWDLTGSDTAANAGVISYLGNLGVNLSQHHDASLVTPDFNIVIYSAAIPASNPERQQAEALGVPQLSYVEAVAQVVDNLTYLAVAGTHGKSSTTAWIAALLESTGASPTFVCGAERLIDGRNGKLGSDDLAIVEACEYRNHFHRLRPAAICLLGIEADHFDCFSNFQRMVESYTDFLNGQPKDGLLIYNADCPITSEVVHSVATKSVSFSIERGNADWFCQRDGEKVDVYRAGTKVHTFQFGAFGRHHLMNLTAALASLDLFGVELSCSGIAELVRCPPQLKRRFETVATGRLGTIIDDYAHHPTEVRMTIAAAREQFPDSRIRCCFQPHQLSRTENLYEEFLEALALSDSTFILPVFGAREQPSAEFDMLSKKLVKDLQRAGHQAMFIGSLDQVWRTLETDANRNDILLTLGAGDITRIHNERTR